MSWTAEEVAVLKAGWTGGRAARSIAADLGMSKSAVVAKAHRMGLPRRQHRSLAFGAHQDGAGPTAAGPAVGRPSAGCQWPIGDPALPGFRFCGGTVMDGGHAPYCAAHHARAYVTVVPGRLAVGLA